MKYEIVGFTGTRKGMTDAQANAVRVILSELKPKQVHHGDAVGADAQFHGINAALGIAIVVHPPLNVTWQAHLKGRITHTPQPYHVRNKAILDASDVVIAAPGITREVVRGSGVWCMIRHCRTRHIPLVIIYPEGHQELSNGF